MVSRKNIIPLHPATHSPGTPGRPATLAKTNAPPRLAFRPPGLLGRSVKSKDRTGPVVAGNLVLIIGTGDPACSSLSEEGTIVVLYSLCKEEAMVHRSLLSLLPGSTIIVLLSESLVRHCHYFQIFQRKTPPCFMRVGMLGQ